MKQKEFNDLAAAMEENCGDWEHSKGLSDAARARLLAKVEAMEQESGKKTRQKTVPFPRKKRYLLVLAAALVLLMGMGVVGDRVWISDSNNLERESEVSTKIDNEEKSDILFEEEAICQEIGEKLGIAPLWLGYLPDGMTLDSYTVIEDTGWVCMNYLYNEQLICVQMAKDNVEVSSNVQWDGAAEKIEQITNIHGYEDYIEAYCIDEKNHNYGANISYGNGYYNIAGYFHDLEDFLQILDGIYFKNL